MSYHGYGLIALAGLVLSAALMSPWYPDLPPALALLLAGVAALPALCLAGWLIGFAKETGQHRSVRRSGVALKFAQELRDSMDMEQAADLWQHELDALADQLAVTLRRCVVVYILPGAARLSRLFGSRMAGCALTPGDVIIVGAQYLHKPEEARRAARHELAHLLSSRWGKLRPALKAEGLAAWLEGAVRGSPVDLRAAAVLLGGSYVPLWRLIDDKTFHSPPIQGGNYALAGSFAGFLLDRHGLDTYREFFGLATGRNFLSAFEETFGGTVAEAEREWRRALLARAEDFGEQLSQQVTETHLVTLLRAWQLLPCLREAEPLVASGHASGVVLWTAGECHLWLGNYNEAVSRLEQAVGAADLSGFWLSSGAWLSLGKGHDCLGNREEAIRAYEQVLALPDQWDPGSGSLHIKARRHLKTPFSEQALMQSWQETIYPTTSREPQT